jgi:hypothetical protein
MAAVLLPDALRNLIEAFLPLGCVSICWQSMRKGWIRV